MQSEIPFNRPFVTGNELHYISELINSGHLHTDGFFTQACSRLLAERFGIYKVLMTPSCTAALEMAAILCDVRPGDEVVMPSFTFASTANSVVCLGAKPVFVDIRPDTLNIDETRIEVAITPNTKAIIPVHYAGTSCEMDKIIDIASRYNLRVIEDAAQGINSFYKKRALGSIGDLGAYSFHYTKNYICGEGGALCLNNVEMAERAEVIREKGTDRSRFLRGQTDKYTWVDVGSSYAPSEIITAFLYAQLEALQYITERRRELYHRYQQQLRSLEERGLIVLPSTPLGCDSNYHLYHILLPNPETRDALIAYLRDNGIQALFHYIPLHSSPMGKKFGYRRNDLPITERLSECLLRLPLYPSLTEEDQTRIVRYVVRFLEHQKSQTKFDGFVAAASASTSNY